MGFRDAIRSLRAPDVTAAFASNPIPAIAPAAIAGASVARGLASPWSPQGALMTVALADILGDAATAALPMTRTEGMSVPAAARARNLLCSTVAGLQLTDYTGRRSDDPADWTRTDVQPEWIDRADGALPPYQRMTWTVDDLYWSGFSLWTLTVPGTSVEFADRIDRSRWEFGQDGRVRIDGKLPADAGYPSTVLIAGPHEGLLNFAKRTLTHASRLLHAAETASANPSAAVDLHQTQGEPLPLDQRRELIDGWVKARNGENGGVAYTSPLVEARPLGTFDAHLLVEGRNAAAVDVARAASVPASAIDANGGSSLTYQTVRDNARNLIDTGAGAYLGAISGALSVPHVTPRGRFLAFDLERWLSEKNPAPLAVDRQAAEPAAERRDAAPEGEETTGA